MQTSIATWYLSFVDPTLAPPPEEQHPGGPSFLGIAFVSLDAPFIEVVRFSHLIGVNPGGEVQGAPVPTVTIPPEMRNTFIPRDEVEIMDDKVIEYMQVMQSLHDVDAWPTHEHLTEFQKVLETIAPDLVDRLNMTPRSAYDGQ